MTSFYERPILNSPYRAPEWHHPLDDNGQPLEGVPRPGRRPSRLIVPVPASRKKAAAAQVTRNDLEDPLRVFASAKDQAIGYDVPHRSRALCCIDFESHYGIRLNSIWRA